MQRRTLKFIVPILAILLVLAGVEMAPIAAQTAAPTEAAISGTVVFPDLTGPYKVGRTAYEWIDQGRDETYASAPGLKRDLMVDIWFPATPAKRARIAPYMEDSIMWANVTGHPELEDIVHPRAYITNAVATDKPSFPILIFESDQEVVSFYYTSTLEELASHGYIVIGMTHPYSTKAITYPDGRVVTAGLVPEAIPLQSANGSPSAKTLTVWTQDVQFVLDQATKLNESDPAFKGHLDLMRIGIIGHAVGGTSAIKSAATDPRIKAAASLDSLKSDDALSKPFLVVGSELPPTAAQQTKDTFWMNSPALTFLNFGDFTMLPAAAAVPAFANSGGSIEPKRGVQIINSYLLAFFDHYLNGADLNWPKYDETKLITFPPAS